MRSSFSGHEARLPKVKWNAEGQLKREYLRHQPPAGSLGEPEMYSH
jgi:hypothetical protein